MAGEAGEGLPSEAVKEGVIAPVPGSAEHTAALAKKFDDHQAAAAEAAKPAAAVDTGAKQRPEGVPEKFWDADKGEVRTAELLKSYSELESGKNPAEAAADPKAADPALAAADAKEAEALAEMDGYSKELADKGKLSDESYTKLEAKGYARATVDAYIEGQQALAEVRRSEAFTEAGGEAQYAELVKWGTTGLDAAAREAFNKGISGTRAEAKSAVMSLKAAHTKAFGQEPVLMGGSQTVVPGAGYASMQQATVDMADARYKTDPAFRAKVMAKLEAATF